MDLYCVTIGWEKGPSDVVGVYTSLEKAKKAIRDHFIYHWEWENNMFFEWDEFLLTDEGYGSFDDGWGNDVEYEISKHVLDEEIKP